MRTLFLYCFVPLLCSFLPTTLSAHTLQKTAAKSAHPIQQPAIIPQLEIYEAHQGDNKNYLIALYTHQSGAALISYHTPTCQANSHGMTRINPKDSSKIEFTAREDQYCKITLQTAKNHTLKVLKETRACSTWHGDFCDFSSLSSLSRIYPVNTP